MSPYHNIPTAQLYERLSHCLGTSAEAIREAAGIWMELRKRGSDLSRYPSSLHRILPLVAGGKLLAEAVIELAGENTKLIALTGLPLDMQRDLVTGRKEVVIPGASEPRPYSAIGAEEARRLLAGGKINTVAEQEAQLPRIVKPMPLPMKTEVVEQIKHQTWRVAFKHMWQRGTPADRAWAINRYMKKAHARKSA